MGSSHPERQQPYTPATGQVARILHLPYLRPVIGGPRSLANSRSGAPPSAALSILKTPFAPIVPEMKPQIAS